MKRRQTKPLRKLKHEVTASSMSAKKEPPTNIKYNLDADESKLESSSSSLVVIPKGSGLTLRKWRDLADKDSSLLTKTELLQLEATNRMIADMLKQVDVASAFSTALIAAQMIKPLASSVVGLNKNAIAFVGSVESMRKAALVPIEAMLTIQKSLNAYNEQVSKMLADITSAAFAVSSMFEWFRSYHTRVIKSLSVDISSLVRPTWLSGTESIEFGMHQVSDQDGHVFIQTEARQVYTAQPGYVYISEAKLDLLITEMTATRSEMSEVRKMLQPGTAANDSGTPMVKYADATFHREGATLILKEYQIPIRKNSKQARFCETFFKSPSAFKRKWDIGSFFLGAYGKRIHTDITQDEIFSCLKGYVNALNLKIAAFTKGHYQNFFILIGLEIYINRDYLSNL